MPGGLDRKLDEHREALLACRRCAHAPDVRPIVSLARSPKVMLIGQAPGKVEAGGGRPFAGRAGKTLFGWLASAGIDEASARSRMYIAAVTRCYPGPSPSGRGDRVPSPAERANCAQWLENEMRIIRPVLVVPVGRLAIDALLGDQPLDRVIGREHRLSEPFATTAIPLPHPSGASSWIHHPGHRRLLDDALSLISRRWKEIHASRRVA
jgi:uracil-DNA glycosylase